jgi:hypothetical protein
MRQPVATSVADPQVPLPIFFYFYFLNYMVSFYGLIIWCDTEALDFETCTPHTHTHTHTVREFVPVGDGNTCRAPPRAVVCVRVDVRVCVGAFVFAVQPVATKCSCPSVFSIAAHEPIYIGG